ncbi:hypothetical protein HID58_036466, partial [Brassica napus]
AMVETRLRFIFVLFSVLVSPSRRRERRFMWLSVALLSSTPRRLLGDSSATSPLEKMEEKGDVSIDGSARGRMTAIWVERLSRWRYGDISNGKPRSDHWCLSDTQINAADRSMSGSRRTIQVQEEDKRRLLVRLMKRSGQCEKMEQWEWNNHGVSVVLRSWRLVSRSESVVGLAVLESCGLEVLLSWSLVVLECCSTCSTCVTE